MAFSNYSERGSQFAQERDKISSIYAEAVRMIPPPANGGAAQRRRAYVYLLRSRQDGSYYVGWTTDVLRRLAEHNQGRSTYSRRKPPWQLMGVEVYVSSMAAKARERVLKRSPRNLARFKKRVLARAALGRPSQGVG